MDSTGKVTSDRRVKMPTPSRIQGKLSEQEQPAITAEPQAVQSIDNLPTGRGTRAIRQAAVLQLQRTRGNAFVMRQIEPDFQRQEGEMAAAQPGGPSQISGSGGTVSTAGGAVEITGGAVNVNSGFTKVSGVLQADTVIATNVVGSNYTPGAGNVW